MLSTYKIAGVLGAVPLTRGTCITKWIYDLLQIAEAEREKPEDIIIISQ
jgi:hypothetical protein